MSCVPSASIWKGPFRSPLTGEAVGEAAAVDELVLVELDVGNAEVGVTSLTRLPIRRNEARARLRRRLRHPEFWRVLLELRSAMLAGVLSCVFGRSCLTSALFEIL